MTNKEFQLIESIAFNLQQQFISKYATTTLINSTYGNEQTLFFKKDKIQILDLYLHNFAINNNDLLHQLDFSHFASEEAQFNNNSRKFEEIINNDIIKLPNAKPAAKIRLVDCLTNKTKNAKTKNVSMDLKTLASILNFAFKTNTKTNHRPYASVGGLYPIYLYLYIINVENLENGFYQYQPFHQSLKKIRIEKIDISILGPFSQQMNQTGAVMLFYVYNSYINRFKFANQAPVLAGFETGMMMQNLQLLSYEFNFSLCHSSIYYPSVILKKLKLNDYYGQYLFNVSIIGSDNHG